MNRLVACCIRSLFLFVCLCPAVSFAADQTGIELELAPPFRDNMVLQRGINLPVWGIAPPGSTITVVFEQQHKTTRAGDNGAWRVELEPLEAVQLATPQTVPQGLTMTVSAEHEGKTSLIKLQNLVVGDVWLCAGQSNMAGRLKGKGTYQGELADYPGLRHWTPEGQGPWLVCSPESAGEFKKTAFYFGRDVYRESRVPIGLVVSAVGGSNIESWLNQKPYETGENYRKLIEPLVGMGIRGVVWYQGESNANKVEPYRPLLTSLIEGWREAWGQGDFPVYFVQLPGIGEAKNEVDENKFSRPGWPALRQDQLETLSVKNTGMAVTIDIGDTSVHPPNKVDTGRRLARLALHHAYGMEELTPTGPLYKGYQIKGNTVRIQFDYADNGLMLAEKQGIEPPVATPKETLQCLAIRGEDGAWHPAQGVIDGSELVVSSKDVEAPVAVRYAYMPRPDGSLLYNKDGLPASPFETRELKR